MSRPANPLTIGAFLVGGVVLLIIGLIVFGGGKFFEQRLAFVIFFDSSLNGLNVGAPVKMRGVQVGSVKEVVVQLDPETARLLAPVTIEIDPKTILTPRGEPLRGDDSNRDKKLKKWIELGIRARLETQSLLTGLLYVDLGYHPETPIDLIGKNFRGLPELPAIPTRVDVAVNSLEEFLNDVRKLPLKETFDNLSVSIAEIKRLLDSEDARASRADFAKTMAETKVLIANLNRQLSPILTNLDGAVRETRGMVADLRTDIRPLLTSTERALDTATGTLQKAEGAMVAFETATGPDSGLNRALDEIATAGRSVRLLADYLERNPSSVIFGKPGGD